MNVTSIFQSAEPSEKQGAMGTGSVIHAVKNLFCQQRSADTVKLVCPESTSIAIGNNYVTDVTVTCDASTFKLDGAEVTTINGCGKGFN